MLPECPPDIGSTYPDPGAYSENRSIYITAAWSRTPPNSLSDDNVPAMLVIGANDRDYPATKPGKSEVTYQNAPLTPEAQYCFFILTRLKTSVPNVSLLYIKLSSLLCILTFTFCNRYTRQVTLNLLQLPLVSKCYCFYHSLSSIVFFYAPRAFHY